MSEPRAAKPGPDPPALEKSAFDEPALDEPGPDEPALDEPALDEPGPGEPGPEEPGPDLHEARWPAALALLAIGALNWTLPNPLSAGPRWLLLIVVAVLLVPAIWARYRGNHRLTQTFGFIANAVVTLDLIWSLGLLVVALPSHSENPRTLLISAVIIWIINILVFASWYWRLDSGGPGARELRDDHTDGDFLFPQMTLSTETKRAMGEDRWNPRFVDYLFLAFNTSTAFSPTDVPVLTRWAKVLTMIQSLISLTTVVLVAARAVNIL